MRVNFKIAAIVYISLSEIQKVCPTVTEETVNNRDSFNRLLHDLGMDTSYPYEVQNVTHRNRFNEVVTGLRFVGNERTDRKWVNSGYASIEAKDKYLDNRLITDLYRQRGMIEN